MVYYIKRGESMDNNFIRDRITQLRMIKGVSEYRMSYDLGHSRSYIYNISSGKSLPPMNEFLAICDYFEITPAQFFSENVENPKTLLEFEKGFAKLNDADAQIVLDLINRLNK